ncbi:hypothetical protein FSP39_007342 [Pinctada imbricata]|uniref:L-Fucosyltransferase n=1 Tax=Pinctada imbricata TaxID=66713 RepID=A0AA89C8K4_PINIB|nr:hypothetical protein FSP39_007342 [Pinctada imbricata]
MVGIQKRLFFLICAVGVITLMVYILTSKERIVHFVHRTEFVTVVKNVFLSKECKELRSTERRESQFVTFKFSGRLANWMFAYASLLGIARKNNRKLCIGADNPLTSAFVLEDLNVCNTLTCSDDLYEDRPCAFDPRFDKLPPSNITIHGYLQSWKYFIHIHSDVKKTFRFQDWMRNEAHSHLKMYTQKIPHDLVIAIHVRRQDMMLKSSLKLGFKAAPLEYILNAKRYFTRRLKNKVVLYVVVTDDYEWCLKFLSSNDTVILPTGDRYTDLAIISMCNHTIITTGTYGWWGAYLAGGETVYYKNFPEPGSKLDGDTEKADFFPPSWIPLNKSSLLKSHSLFLFFSYFVCVLQCNKHIISI